MAQDIELLNALYLQVPAILLPKSGGGQAVFTDVSPTTAVASDVAQGKKFYLADGSEATGTASGGGGGGAYAWFGANAEKVNTVINKMINLSTDTSYDSWSASTASTTIKATSSTPDYTLSDASGDYDYCFVTKAFCQPVYNAGATLKSTTYRFCYVSAYAFFGFPDKATIADIQSGSPIGITFNNYNNHTSAYPHIYFYYNNIGKIVSYGIPYGPMYIDTSETVSASVSSGKFTFNYKLPAIKARCNSSRFATSMKTQVNSAATNMSITVDLIRCPRDNGFGSAQFKTMMDMINAA